MIPEEEFNAMLSDVLQMDSVKKLQAESEDDGGFGERHQELILTESDFDFLDNGLDLKV